MDKLRSISNQSRESVSPEQEKGGYSGKDLQKHTHTRLTALFLRLPRWAGTRKVKPIWILLKQETVSGSGISWAICKSAPCSRQTTTHQHPTTQFFTGRMPFLPLNQQRQSTEGKKDLQKRKVLRLEWNTEGVVDNESGESMKSMEEVSLRIGWVRIGEINVWLMVRSRELIPEMRESILEGMICYL